MSSTRIETNPLKKRRFWWMESGFFWFVGVFYCGFSLLAMFILYIFLDRAMLGLELFAGFWLIILPIVIWFYKRTLSEHYSVDQSVVARTKRSLVAHRVSTYEKLHQTEINLLERGQSTPVLDVWKLDPNLARRHPFFRRANTIHIDPVHRELHIRLELENFKRQVSAKRSIHPLLDDLQSFIRTIAGDGHLKSFDKYFRIVVIEANAQDVDDRGGQVSYPVLSILMKSEQFWMVPKFAELGSLYALGEVRFDNGKVIRPHRAIEIARSGSK